MCELFNVSSTGLCKLADGDPNHGVGYWKGFRRSDGGQQWPENLSKFCHRGQWVLTVFKMPLSDSGLHVKKGNGPKSCVLNGTMELIYIG